MQILGTNQIIASELSWHDFSQLRNRNRISKRDNQIIVKSKTLKNERNSNFR